MNLDTSITEPVFTNSIREEDRFSILSKDVLHHLLSFLTIEDLAKLSFVSKKYENLCLSIPSLTIDCDDITSVQRTQLMDFIVSFIKNRKGTQTTRLAIYWCDDKLTFNQTFRVLSWLNHAIACHPNEIVIAIDFESNTFMIPVEVFWYISLRHHMEVDLAGGKLELPSPYGFSYLKFLHLSGLEVVDEALGDWISSTCRFLEKLKLIRICGVNKFRIKSASLQAINVSKCRFQYIEISAQLLHIISLGVATSALSVNICAPYLFQVDCLGVFPEYFSMEIIKTEVKYFVSLRCNDTCSSATDELQRLLYNIAPVTKLVIDSSAIQLLYENKYLPCAFRDLESVVLSYNIFTNITSPATVLFLQMLPRNLKKLHMDCRFAHDSIEWEWKNFVFIDELEEVEIDLADGRENEEKLVEYFLENAKRLVKITVSSRYYNMSPEIKLKLTEVASAKGGDLRSKRNMVVLELKPREQV